MPLAGLFGKEKERQGPSSSNEKDIRGTVIKLPRNVVTLERKLAEGGFAIVYLASDKNGRQYALKRQFVSEDERQLQACKRECQIISSLSDHKNIVSYIDHMITQSRDGVYDYMLLTAYYRTSVLALMNERLMSSRCLSAKEVLGIFCDMCEAVARLHHSQTPVIHRDLKVENILIDDRKRDAPIYVLCDFGSATTKVLSSETHPHALVEEEVLKYTTLSYRAPEMVDLYAGRPIGTKSDVWAMGVMLYKLCYFALPFGESALAIQNGSFTFPPEPDYPEELRGLLKFLLEPDLELRPDIYQTSCVAFDLAGKRCPVANLHKVPTPTVADVVRLLRGGDRRAVSERTASPKGSVERTPTGYSNNSTAPSSASASGERIAPSTTTTTVNPRLRPKASSNVVRVPLGGTATPVSVVSEPAPHSLSNPDLAAVASVAAPPPSPARSVGNRAQPTKAAAIPSSSAEPSIARPHPVRPQDLGFRDLEEPTVVPATALNPFADASPFRSAEPPEAPLVSLSPPEQHRQPRLEDLVGGSAPQLPLVSPLRHANPIDDFHQHHRRNVSDTSAVEHSLRSSAFKPYRTSQPENVAKAEYPDVDRIRQSDSASPPPVMLDLKSETVSWNPFAAAPYGDQPRQGHHGMDDESFGERFDELPRIQQRAGSLSSTSNVKSRESLVMGMDEKDPFGAAPFDPLQRNAKGRQQPNPPSSGFSEIAPREARDHVNALRPPSRKEWDDADSVGSASDLRQRMQTVSTTEDDSEDEDRVGRRRFSYEHFGGVGDDSSSNSKAADDDEDDDDDSADDGTKDASSSALASSHTLDLTSDETGSRPLLDDDELDDEGVIRHSASLSAVPHPSSSSSSSYHVTAAQQAEFIQLEPKPAVASNRAVTARTTVPTANLEDEMTISPPYITPSETPIADASSSTTTPISRPNLFFGAATVPPPLPKHQNIPVSRPLLPPAGSAGPSTTTLISTGPFNSAPLPMHLASSSKPPISAKPKPPPKPNVSPLLRKKRSSSGSSASSDSPETDDSGAEICSKKASSGAGSGKRKGHARSGRTDEDSSVGVAAPSTAPTVASPMALPSAQRKKSSGKWTTAKGSGSSVLDAASFVNSSFQSEDVEGGSSPRQQVLQHS